jgi:hypothetical protein
LNICELGKKDLDRHDMGQDVVKMMLVNRYDHTIYLGRKEIMLQRNRTNPIVENTQILIFEFE